MTRIQIIPLDAGHPMGAGDRVDRIGAGRQAQLIGGWEVLRGFGFFRGLGDFRRGDRVADGVDAFDDAVGGGGGVFDVGKLDEVAVDGDRAELVVVMGAAAGALVGIERDDRVVHHAVAVGVAIGDVVDFGGVALDDDAVALGAVEVEDRLVAEVVDPVVVQLVVLAGDAVPVDGAVVAGVFLDIAFLGVDQGLEVEDVGAGAAGHGVVAGDRLVGIELAARQLAQRVALVAVRVVGDRRLAGVGARDQEVVAVAAAQDVVAVAAVEDVVAVAADHGVVAIAALQDVVAALAVDPVRAAPAVDAVVAGAAVEALVGLAAGLQHVERAHQVAMRADAVLGEDVLQRVAAVVQLAEQRRDALQRRGRPGRVAERGVDGIGQLDHGGVAELGVEHHDVADLALEQRMRRAVVRTPPGAAAADHQRGVVERQALLELGLGGDQPAVEPGLQPGRPEAQRELVGLMVVEHQIGHLEIFRRAVLLEGDQKRAVLHPDRELAGVLARPVLRDQRHVARKPVEREAQRYRPPRKLQRRGMTRIQIIPLDAAVCPGFQVLKDDETVDLINRIGGRHRNAPKLHFRKGRVLCRDYCGKIAAYMGLATCSVNLPTAS